MDKPKENGIMKIGSTLTRLSMKYMPDPSIFAVVLTFIAFLLGVFVANVSPMQMVVLLEFTFICNADGSNHHYRFCGCRCAFYQT